METISIARRCGSGIHNAIYRLAEAARTQDVGGGAEGPRRACHVLLLLRPFDPEKPTVTSGLRLGSPACTTRGFGAEEFRQVGDMIVEVLDGLAAHGEAGNALVEARVKQAATELCARFPIYP